MLHVAVPPESAQEYLIKYNFAQVLKGYYTQEDTHILTAVPKKD